MLLTGQAKKDFLEYCQKQSHYQNYSNGIIVYEKSQRGEFLWLNDSVNLLQEPKLLNALIIDWLDSSPYCSERYFSITFAFLWTRRISSMSFNDVCEQAIELCNTNYTQTYNNARS